MYRFVVIFSAVVLSSAQYTQVSHCVHHGGALPRYSYVEGCSMAPCLLPQLQDAVIHVEFEAPYAIRRLTTRATAYLSIGLIALPIPYGLGENSVTCDLLTNASCPVREGQALQFTLRMPIEPYFPVGAQATIEMRVEDDNNVPILCARMPIRIVSRVKRSAVW